MDIQTGAIAADPQTEVQPTAAPSLTDLYVEEKKVEPADAEPQPDAAAPAGDSNPDAEPDPDADEPEPEVEAIAAPTSWAKDAKDVFAGLPREAQEIIAKREAERERFVNAKSREAANTRNTVETEARQALTTIMRNHEQSLSQFLPEVPQMPDPRLLASPEHRDLYYQQKAEYDYAVAQRDHVSQQLDQARQHAEAITQQQYEAEIQAEHGALEEALGTEWSDPSARAKLLENLQPIAAELGYSPEVMAQARAADIIALRRIGDFKAKADKYDQLMKKKMEPVRAAKPALPPAARPGAQTGQQRPRGTLATLYPDDVPRN